MGASEVEKYLNYLANEVNVAASTQNQALLALVFLYKHDRWTERTTYLAGSSFFAYS